MYKIKFINMMIVTAVILAIMSEIIFVLGARTIWDGSIFVILLFAVIGLAKYQLVASAFSRQGSIYSMLAVLTPLVIISFITHLSFFTDISNRSEAVKLNITSAVSLSEKQYTLLNTQKQGLQDELKTLDNLVEDIPKGFVSKRLEMMESQKATRDRIRTQLNSINEKLLEQMDTSYHKQKDVNSVKKSSLEAFSKLINIEVEHIIQALNIVVAAIIDIFSLYMTYTVGRMRSEQRVKVSTPDIKVQDKEETIDTIGDTEDLVDIVIEKEELEPKPEPKQEETVKMGRAIKPEPTVSKKDRVAKLKSRLKKKVKPKEPEPEKVETIEPTINTKTDTNSNNNENIKLKKWDDKLYIKADSDESPD